MNEPIEIYKYDDEQNYFEIANLTVEDLIDLDWLFDGMALKERWLTCHCEIKNILEKEDKDA